MRILCWLSILPGISAILYLLLVLLYLLLLAEYRLSGVSSNNTKVARGTRQRSSAIVGVRTEGSFHGHRNHFRLQPWTLLLVIFKWPPCQSSRCQMWPTLQCGCSTTLPDSRPHLSASSTAPPPSPSKYVHSNKVQARRHCRCRLSGHGRLVHCFTDSQKGHWNQPISSGNHGGRCCRLLLLGERARQTLSATRTTQPRKDLCRCC